MKKVIKVLFLLVLLLSLSAVVHVEVTEATATNSKTKVFKNCKELNGVYKHGVTNKKDTKNKIVSKVKDKKTGKTISYKPSKASVDVAVYKLHIKMDNDNDGIACEK